MTQPYAQERIFECNGLLRQARKAELVKAEPRAERIDVDERKWAVMPAVSKQGILLAFACQRFGRPMQGIEGVSAYGYRTGRRLALASRVGVELE